MKNKIYHYVVQPSSFWNKELKAIFSSIDAEFINMKTALSIATNTALRKKIVEGTGAEYCSVCDVCAALEAIFVSRFKKESPEEFERIPVAELRRELQDEFFRTALS